MKVFVLSPKEDWICDRIAREWKVANPDITVDTPQEADVLWLLAGWCWNHIPVDILKKKKVILTIHHIVPDKFDEQKKKEFQIRDQFIDAYHVPNRKTGAVVNQLTKKPIFLLSYWYDKNTWYEEDKNLSKKDLNIPKDKFVIGSFQRDTEGTSGLPKLEKGPDLFCDFVEKISKSKDVHVLLGGWRRGYVIKRLDSANINYTFYEKVSLETLRKMYASCDLYVVASRHEGGPQAILEASSMKVPIVSRDVGIAESVLSPYCIMDIPNQSDLPGPNETIFNFDSVKRFEIKTHSENYIKMFERISQ